MQIEKTTNSMNRCDGLLHGINQDICIANVAAGQRVCECVGLGCAGRIWLYVLEDGPLAIFPFDYVQ